MCRQRSSDKMTHLIVLLTIFGVGSTQLSVNVRNKGGEIMLESIDANVTEDTVTLSLQQTDGTYVTQFIDFRNSIQIFKVVILGELELGQTGHQVNCFVAHLAKDEFISSDAMSKLRQKNPGAVRHPEEDKASEAIQLDLMVDLDQAHVISPHIQRICREARDATYIRDIDLSAISRTYGKDYTVLLGATKRTSLQLVQPCRDMSDPGRPCLCHLTNCILWYPCGLKYCKGSDSTGKTVSYRCGIKTCGKCRQFEYYTRRKEFCMWDLPDVGILATMDEAAEAPPSQRQENVAAEAAVGDKAAEYAELGDNNGET